MATAKSHKTEVSAMAEYKVEYEWRRFLGLFGSWHEVISTRVSKPSIVIETTEEFDKVLINGKEYKTP